jgi:hypothetical protein
MAYQTEILEACQDWGFVLGRDDAMGILPYSGWTTRGGSTFNPHGSVNHHTAGPLRGNLPSLATLLFGRPDVSGPLCNGALARNACIHLLAAGKANHAGLGGWNGLSGNSTVWGLEVEHTGTSAEPVTDAQWEAMHRWHRVCADVSGFPIGNICQHFEWAPTRKVDFVKSITNPDTFRLMVARIDRGDDWMSALTDAEQREVLRTLRELRLGKGTEAGLQSGGPARDDEKSLLIGALAHGLKPVPAGEKPTSPGQGDLIEPFKRIQRDVMREILGDQAVPPGGS